MKNKLHSPKTEVELKTRKNFCALVKYGFKVKELYLLSGYSLIYTYFRCRKCKIKNWG